MRILFISAWYPNRNDSMYGLFVQKHAEAVSLYDDVAVLYVQPDRQARTFEIMEQEQHAVKEIIVYYPDKAVTFFKGINYIRAYRKGYQYLVKEKGFFPDLVHVNILTRTGVMAYLYKTWEKVPYVITEHWSRYLPVRKEYTGCVRKWLTKKVIKHASAVLPVSEDLKKAMLSHQLHNTCYVVVDNVVDNCFWEPQPVEARKKKRILHVSSMDDQTKNVSGILRVTLELSKKRDDFELLIIGWGVDFDTIVEYANKLSFPAGMVHFLGEKTPCEVATYFHNCDFSVLFSNYETFSIVTAESLASGKPVVSSIVSGISEKINNKNGILVPPQDESALFHALDNMLDRFQCYDSNEMKEKAMKKYSYTNVGKILHDIYLDVVRK